MSATEGPYGLTRTQLDALLVIQELTALDGQSPSLTEIAHELCLSNRSGAHWALTMLRDRGFIDWLPYRSRSIVVRHPVPFPEEPEIVGFIDAEPAVEASA